MSNPKAAIIAGASLALAANVALQSMGAPPRPAHQSFPGTGGALGVFAPAGSLARSGPFFESLGSNDRTCATCHEPAAAFSVTPALLESQFTATEGLDPLFRPHDGANSPFADVSTPTARRTAYSLLLARGVFRVGLPVPPGAEFTLDQWEDPYGHAGPGELSLFRRPLPATNLRFASSLMWDGRETDPLGTLEGDLARQAANATLGHAQAAAAPTAEQLDQILGFETSHLTAQSTLEGVGKLDGHGGRGGPRLLASQRYYPGMNDPAGPDPRGRTFDPDVFRLFRAWREPGASPSRRAVARGEKLFNTLKFIVTDVPGFNDVLGQPAVVATCASCHNTPGVGGSSVPREMDIGVSDSALRSPEVPLYTFRNSTTGELRALTDPGRGLVTGKWNDLGKFKVPGLRGLAARAPFFHDGSAATIEEVVQFYIDRFDIHTSGRQDADLAAFMRAL